MSEIEIKPNGGILVIVCAGGCGKTTEDVNPYEFWKGRVEQSSDPEERVPVWTCKECKEKQDKNPVGGVNYGNV